jgi:hypothetical protein
MDGTPTALTNGSRKCRSKSSAPLGLVHFRELFFCTDRTIKCSLGPPFSSPTLGPTGSRPGHFFRWCAMQTSLIRLRWKVVVS